MLVLWSTLWIHNFDAVCSFNLQYTIDKEISFNHIFNLLFEEGMINLDSRIYLGTIRIQTFSMVYILTDCLLITLIA